MAEYIEREALIRRIKEIHCAECDSYHGIRCRACWVDDTLDYIDSEPAADVAPMRHGRWDNIPNTYMSVVSKNGSCSGNATSCSICREINPNLYKTNYCPNCGARMDGGAD